MKCSSCKSEIGVFSSEWQTQRELKIKKCPSCGAEVEAVFGGAMFTKWLIASGAGIAAITYLFSRSAPLALINGLVFGMFVAFFPSLELRPRAHVNSGARRVLNRSIDLPAWLKPPAWLVKLASSVWAVGSYLFLLIAVALGVPFPWSALLLFVLSAIGLIRRASSDRDPTAGAIRSKVGAIGMLLLGIGLVVHRYA
jgi:hypothetical protein